MTFNQYGFQVIKDFLDPDFVKFIQQYFFLRIKSGQATLGDIQSPGSYCFYSDPLIETILDSATDSLSKITGFRLLPTYSYTRLYAKDDELKIHRDRPSCEISATLTLGIPDDEDIQPIYFSQSEDKLNPVKILLNPGDLCLYCGCDLYHWREPFKQRWYLQSFLHYVDANGEYKDHIYDKRNYLGIQK